MIARLFSFVLLLVVLVHGSSYADNASPVLYSRTEIIIQRAVPVKQQPLPWQDADQVETLPDVKLDAEIRDAQTLMAQSGWFNLSSPSYDQGVLLLFGSPAIATIPPSSQYAPLDVMVVDKEGVIREIYPNLMLAELSEPITSKEPALGILFLRGGAYQTLMIKPGDSVVYSVFKKPPAVMSLPASKP